MESGFVLIGFSVVVVFPSLAPVRDVWLTFLRNTLAYPVAFAGVRLQVGTNVLLVAAATFASLRINAATYAVGYYC